MASCPPTWIVALVASAAAALAGCCGKRSADWAIAAADAGLIPGLPHGGLPPLPDGGASDHASFAMGGAQHDVWQSGYYRVTYDGYPELGHDGPLGCAGRRFTSRLTRHVNVDIGYTAKRAFVIVARTPYFLEKPPRVEGKTLVWEGTFRSRDGETRDVTLRIDCPLPKS